MHTLSPIGRSAIAVIVRRGIVAYGKKYNFNCFVTVAQRLENVFQIIKNNRTTGLRHKHFKGVFSFGKKSLVTDPGYKA